MFIRCIVLGFFWCATASVGIAQSTGQSVISAAAPAAVDAHETAIPQPANAWRLSIDPFIWAMELDGVLTVAGLRTSGSLGFDDVIDNLDATFMGAMTVKRGRWSLGLGGIYADLSFDESVSLRDEISFQNPVFGFDLPVGLDVALDANVTLGVASFRAEYDIVDHRFSRSSIGLGKQETGPRLLIAPYAGLRYTSWNTDVTLRLRETVGPFEANQTFRFDESEDWIDLLVGVHLSLVELEKFSLRARADVGGFGVAGGSDLVWSAGIYVSYALTSNISLTASYHVLDYDYQSGSGPREFALDVQLRGPALGLAIMF